MDFYVTLLALILGCACFAIYAGSAIATILAKPHQTISDVASVTKSIAAGAQPKATADDYSKLLDSASKLTDSLSKAGPTLVSLIGAILFFLIAAVSSGALKNPPPAASSNAPTNAAVTNPK